MKKNLYAALLLLCFVMLVLPQKNVFAAASAPSPWAEESIKLANDAGLIPTDLNDDYQANITRREFCHVIMRFVHKSWEPVPEFPIDMKSPFSDVDDRLVNIAYELKITSGTGENKFNPDGFITRQEAAAMLYNAAKDYYGGKSYSPVTFADSAQIASWAKDKVQAVAGSGVLQGTSQTEFNPLGTYTREQCYVSVLRLHNLYVDSVKTANAETEYNSLTNANIRQLEEYIEKYPDSSFAKSAASRAEKLKNDLAPYNAVILKGLTDKNVETFIKDYPGHIKTEDLKNELKISKEGITADIHELVSEGKISLKITGRRIDETVVEITNKTKSKLTVTVPLGTWFKSGSSSVQNMLVTADYSYTIEPGETIKKYFSTACMNMNKSIPDSDNSFTIDYYSDSHKLNRLINILNENNASYPVIQAAVWILTDNASDSDLKYVLVNGSGQSVITQNDINKAKEYIKMID